MHPALVSQSLILKKAVDSHIILQAPHIFQQIDPFHPKPIVLSLHTEHSTSLIAADFIAKIYLNISLGVCRVWLFWSRNHEIE